MLTKNRSGQYLYFSMISALSGNAVTGISGSISGRKSLDGLSGMIVLSGNIIELGGGSFRANLYDFDTNGDYAGYLFTASGCVPVQYSIVTWGGSSGSVNIASGPNVVVPTSTISGVVANSGLFVTVPISTISGVVANSGLNVTVPISTLSGTIVNSGLFVTVPISTISGAVANSGLNVIADVSRWRGVTPNTLISSGRIDAAFNIRTGVARSGTSTTLQLDAGTPTGVSGIFDGQRVTIIDGSGALESRIIQNYDSSGNLTVFPAWAVAPNSTTIFTITPTGAPLSGATFFASGESTLVYSGQLSGQVVNLLSGNQVAVVSGTNVNTWSGQTQIASGPFVNATATVASGQVYLASGHFLFGSGQFFLASGSITSGLIASGIVFIASGPFVNATATVASGQLYLASGSIFMNTFASGVIGGGSGNIPSSWGASGATTVGQNLDKVGYSILSGVINSGQFTVATTVSGTTFLSSGQAVGILSGQTTLIYSGQLSGQVINLLSGNQVAVVSGTNVTPWSGQVYLNSGTTAVEIPTNYLKFNMSGITGEAQRSPINALRKLINKFDAGVATSGYLSVYKENDSTVAYTQAITATSGASPITALDTQ